jgi:hypothetical protein
VGLWSARIGTAATREQSAETGERRAVALAAGGLLRPDHVGERRHRHVETTHLHVHDVARKVFVSTGPARLERLTGRHVTVQSPIFARVHGREKLHFMSPVPIRLVHDRWIDKYTERQVTALIDLKHELEGGSA